MGEAAPESGKGGKYGVRLVRGPFVRLSPHVEDCREDDFLAYAARLRAQGHRLAADLFSGAGGLSLGLEAAGYRVVLGVDRDPEAAETHRHHFGGLTVNWDLEDPERIARVAQLIRDAQVELLAGGPPCQPFSRAGQKQNPAPGSRRVRRSLRRAQAPVAFLPRGRQDRPASGRVDGERPGHGTGQRHVHPPDHGSRTGEPGIRG